MPFKYASSGAARRVRGGAIAYLIVVLGVACACAQPRESSYLPAWPTPGGCPYLRTLRIVRHNVFRTTEPEARHLYGWLANRLHTVTRESVIRRGLLFEPGKRVCREDLEVSIRRLRTYPFLHSEILTRATGAGDSIDVTLITRDVWSLLPELKLSKRGEILDWSIALRESNLIGLGKALALELGEEDQRTFWGLSFSDHQGFGRDIYLRLALAHGSALDRQGLTLVRHFARPASRSGYWLEAGRLKGERTDRRGGVDGPVWDETSWRLHAAAGRRVAARGPYALRLMGMIDLASERFHLPPGEEPYRGETAAEGLRDRETRALGLLFDLVVERYAQLRSIDTLGEWEDFNLGTELRVEAGFSARDLGASREGLVWAIRGQQGLGLGPRGFLLGGLFGQGQVIGGEARDTRLALAVRGYASAPGHQTLALRLQGEFCVRCAPQDLPTLGAGNGLRGFDAYRFWGERILVANLEDRIVLCEDLFGLISLGLAGFLDTGLHWLSGASHRARPRMAAGIGLRTQASRASERFATRIDLGHPLLGGEEGDDWVLSFAAGQAF